MKSIFVFPHSTMHTYCFRLDPGFVQLLSFLRLRKEWESGKTMKCKKEGNLIYFILCLFFPSLLYLACSGFAIIAEYKAISPSLIFSFSWSSSTSRKSVEGWRKSKRRCINVFFAGVSQLDMWKGASSELTWSSFPCNVVFLLETQHPVNFHKHIWFPPPTHHWAEYRHKTL